MKIDKKSKLADVLKVKGAEKVLEKYKLPCLHCPFAKMEAKELSLEQIAETYDLELENMVKKLNSLKVEKL